MIPERNIIIRLARALIVIALTGTGICAPAQVVRDSATAAAPAQKPHSIKMATILAASIPGAGQAYNRKYWKIPIAYAGYAGAGFALVYFQKNYKQSKRDYLALTDTLEETVYEGNRTKDMLLSDINSYRRFRDMSVLGLLAWHGLTIIDANVDAHFFFWDVNENLSMNIRPRPLWLRNNQPGMGVSLVFNLK